MTRQSGGKEREEGAPEKKSQAAPVYKVSLIKTDIPFSQNRLLQGILILFAIYWTILALSPADRVQWLLENLLVVGAMLLLLLTYRRIRFTNLSYLLMVVFLCMHTYAAHYTYQNTPFDRWLKPLLETDRSYYDRVVHFAFGLLLAFPLREVLTRFMMRPAGFRSYALPAVLLLAFSALFEIGEWFVAILGGSAGEDYLGLQGDIFDTHKDMGLGFAGGILAMGLVAWILRKRYDRQEYKEKR